MAASRKKHNTAAYRTNGAAAYDVGYTQYTYGNTAPARKPAQKPKRQPKPQKRARAKLTVAPLAVAGMLLAGLMLLLVICGYVQLYEATNEVGQLQDEIATLQEKNEIERELHREKTQALELQNRMERSRLQQLRSQIDPHFLFNTLNVIQQTAGVEKGYRTQALIVALSHLLRYSLMSNDEQVPLSREVRIVDEY